MTSQYSFEPSFVRDKITDMGEISVWQFSVAILFRAFIRKRYS